MASLFVSMLFYLQKFAWLLITVITTCYDLMILVLNRIRDHPFKTSACSRGGGVKNLPNLPTDSTKKLPTVGG